MSDPAEPPKHTREQTPEDVERMLTPPSVPSAPPLPALPQPLFAVGDSVPGLTSWVLERRLGAGGFGEVWLARHDWKKGEAPRAVKFCTHPAARHRLATHEKRVVVRVMKHAGEHPNVVPLLDCNLDGNLPWLMYEFVEGGTLAETIRGWSELPFGERLAHAFRTLHAIASALGHCHRLSPAIVHRDLKPANVLMAGTAPRITDFGIGGLAVEAAAADATDTFSGATGKLPSILQTSGSVRYAPPEQLFGSAPDPRDDVYALGVIAYQMVMGDLKTTPGTDAADTLGELGVPTDFISLVVKSVATDPVRRPKDAREWEAILAALEAKRPAAPAAVELPPRTVSVTVPGLWHSRPRNAPAEPWAEIATTPTEVTLDPSKEYRLTIAYSTSDRVLDNLRPLEKLPALQHLDLSFTQLSDAGLARLKGFALLRQLDLEGCEQVTDAGLAHLKGLTALQQLNLEGCARIGDAGLAHLAGLTALQQLNLRWCTKVTDAGLAHLSRCTDLRQIHLWNTQLTDAGLATLAGFPELQQLDLEGTPITDTGLAHLRQLPALQQLDLSLCARVTDAGLAHLGALGELQRLNLGGCAQITDAGLLRLMGLSALRHLNLRGCVRITDEGLARLAGLTALQSLVLSGCETITDEGLEILHALAELRELYLSGCEWVTDAGIAALTAALPGCKVQR